MFSFPSVQLKGDIKEIDLKKDEKFSRQSCFIEYEEVEDAEEAIFNMDEAEFFGKIIKVEKSKKRFQQSDRPIWENEDYQKEHLGADKGDENEIEL